MSFLFGTFRAAPENRNRRLIVSGLRGSLVSALAVAFTAIGLVVASRPAASDQDGDVAKAPTQIAHNAPRRSGP